VNEIVLARVTQPISTGSYAIDDHIVETLIRPESIAKNFADRSAALSRVASDQMTDPNYHYASHPRPLIRVLNPKAFSARTEARDPL